MSTSTLNSPFTNNETPNHNVNKNKRSNKATETMYHLQHGFWCIMLANKTPVFASLKTTHSQKCSLGY